MGKKGGCYFYAVARGHRVGVYHTWDECKAQVDGYSKARYKKFESNEAALDFISQEGPVPGNSASAPTRNPNGNFGDPASASFPPSSQNLIESAAFDEGFHKQCSRGTVPSAVSAYGITSSFVSKSASKKPAAGNVFVGFGSAAASQTSSVSSSSSVPAASQTRQFSTTRPVEKRKITMTDERVVNKRSKVGASDNAGVDLSKYSVDESGYVVVYTDGACSKNGRTGAKAGIGVWFGDRNKLNVSEPVQGRATNNTAEIQAAERAIRQAKSNGITKLNVKTDSQFVIKCVTEWMNKWQRNGWKLRDGKPVINKEDLEKLSAAAADMNIKWSYVPGHKGHHGNEAADRLAVEGATRF